MAALLGSARGREISGILSRLFTNLLTDGPFLGAPFSAIRDAKASVFPSSPGCEEG